MRIKLTTIALAHDERLFAEGVVVVGRDLAEGEAFGENEIPMDLAVARVAAGTAQVIMDLRDGLSPEFTEALAAYVSAIRETGERLVVVLDLADQGGDAEVVAIVDAIRAYNGEMIDRLGERLDGVMIRARDVTHRELDKLDAEDLAAEGSKASNAIDAAASSNGGIEGAAHVTAAPDILTGSDSIDGGFTDDLVVADASNDSVLGGAADDGKPVNETPALVEVVADAAAQADAADSTAGDAGSNDNPRSEGGGPEEVTEALAVVVEAAPVATPKPAKKSPSPKKSGA